MGLSTIYIDGTPGLTHVYHPDLAYAEVMFCARAGKQMIEVAAGPVGNQFTHNQAEAKIELPADQPIEAYPGYDPNSSNDLPVPEKFIIQLKTI